MTVVAEPKAGDAFYNPFYEKGGWKYAFWREFRWHRREVVKRFNLRRGMRLLEVACGNGFHTDLFRRMGYPSVGVDRAPAGIAWARDHYPRSTYHCCDIMDMAGASVPLAGFDVVLARGLSHYHYDLASDQAMSTTRQLLRYLKPDGLIVMVIVSDLSGKCDGDGVWQNTLEAYEQHFGSFGRPWSVNWMAGVVVSGLAGKDRPVSFAMDERHRHAAGPGTTVNETQTPRRLKCSLNWRHPRELTDSVHG